MPGTGGNTGIWANFFPRRLLLGPTLAALTHRQFRRARLENGAGAPVPEPSPCALPTRVVGLKRRNRYAMLNYWTKFDQAPVVKLRQLPKNVPVKLSGIQRPPPMYCSSMAEYWMPVRLPATDVVAAEL
jgi:hypothetical protein